MNSCEAEQHGPSTNPQCMDDRAVPRNVRACNSTNAAPLTSPILLIDPARRAVLGEPDFERPADFAANSFNVWSGKRSQAQAHGHDQRTRERRACKIARLEELVWRQPSVRRLEAIASELVARRREDTCGSDRHGHIDQATRRRRGTLRIEVDQEGCHAAARNAVEAVAQDSWKKSLVQIARRARQGHRSAKAVVGDWQGKRTESHSDGETPHNLRGPGGSHDDLRELEQRKLHNVCDQGCPHKRRCALET